MLRTQPFLDRPLKISRRCAAVILLLGPVATASPAATGAKAAHRHVVLMITDDQGLEMGCAGHPVIQTPHLDALAAESTRFTSAFCTTASCSASRSVILTGLHNHANGQYGHEHAFHRFRTRAGRLTLPALFGAAGYDTVRVGKLHVGPDETYPFDTVLKASSRNPVQMAKAVSTWLDKPRTNPFFLYICPSDPHRGGGRDASRPGAPDRFGNGDQPGVTPIRYDADDMIVPAWLPDTAECREELAQYAQSVSRVDQGVGALVTALRDHGLLDETLFVFLSDHGPAFPGAKTTVYEPGLRIPLLIRRPGFDAAVCDAMVSTTDLVPTLLEWAGVEDETARHGHSFLSVAWPSGANATNERDAIFASHTFHEVTMYYPMRVVRERQYKLIFNLAHPLPFPFATDLWAASTWQAQWAKGPTAPYGVRTVDAYRHRPRFELYDLQHDPHEASNLADDPAHAATLTRLQARLKAFQADTNDPWRLKWDRE